MRYPIPAQFPLPSTFTLLALFAATACSAGGTTVSTSGGPLPGEDDGGPTADASTAEGDAGTSAKDAASTSVDASLADPKIEFDLKIDGAAPSIAKFKVERSSPSEFVLAADFDTSGQLGAKKNLWFKVTIADAAAAGTADCNYAANPDVAFDFSSMKNGTQSFLSATTCSRTISRAATTGFTVGTASGVMVSGGESATFTVKWAQKTPP